MFVAMSALQGVLFNATTKATYVIMNRVNYTIDLNLTASVGFSYMQSWTYIANQSIPAPYTFDISTASIPYAGPIPVTTAPQVATNGNLYVATLAPYPINFMQLWDL